MQLQPIENAIRAWVKMATGLSDPQVYFDHQNVPQPQSAPFVTISIAESGTTLGLPEIDRTTNLALPAGTEVQQAGTSIWDISILFQAFAENTVTYSAGGLPNTSGLTAVELLAKVQLALNLESVHDPLNDAGISPYEYGVVRRLDAVIETGFEGRAVLEMKCYVADTVTEGVGYIDDVTGSGELSGDTPDPIIVPIDLPS